MEEGSTLALKGFVSGWNKLDIETLVLYTQCIIMYGAMMYGAMVDRLTEALPTTQSIKLHYHEGH